MRNTGENPTYLKADMHGTNQVAVASTNYAVTRRTLDPYGNPLGAESASPWPDNRGFLNKPTNTTTGLTDIGARNYDPTLGAFISVDPILDLASPQQWTGYTYANNNPTTLSDPTGLEPQGGPCAGGKNSAGYSCTQSTDWVTPPNSGGRGGGSGGNRPGTTTYPNGTVASGGPEGNYINGHKMLDSGPDIYELARRFDQYVPTHMRNGTSATLYHDGVWTELDMSFALTDVCGMDEDFCGRDFMEFAMSANMSALAEMDSGVRARVGMKIPLKKKSIGDDDCSFDGDTEVLMADGSTKPIQDIQPGDFVMAADPETGERGARRVSATSPHSDTLYLLVLADGSTIDTTEDHPFWNATDRQWQRADAIDPGDQVLASNGQNIAVLEFKTDVPRDALVFDITVEGLHSYYVSIGLTSVLAHNCPMDDLVYVYRAPRTGDKWDELDNGLNPNRHAGGNGFAYIGTEDVAKKYADYSERYS